MNLSTLLGVGPVRQSGGTAQTLLNNQAATAQTNTVAKWGVFALGLALSGVIIVWAMLAANKK